MKLAKLAGIQYDPWQRFVLDHGLAVRNNLFSSFEVGLIIPRQNGKTAVLEARALAGLFVLPEKLILHSAHEFKSAREQFLRIEATIMGCPRLKREVARVWRSHGEEGIELHDGSRLRFVARTSGSGRGFSPDCVILDEAYHLSPEALSALFPALMARPNPQLWYASSAGLEGSETLRALRGRGSAPGGAEGLAYMEWSAHEDCDPADPDAWRQANPALGIRIPERIIRLAQQSLDPEAFAREHLGIWADARRMNIWDMGVWGILLDPESEPAGNVVLGIDVTPARSHAAIAAYGVRADGHGHAELIETRAGTDWTLRTAVAIHEAQGDNLAAVMVAPDGPAAPLIEPLRRAGLPVETLSVQEYAHGCAGLVDAVNNETVRHRGQADLDAAIIGTEKRILGDGLFVWSRKQSGVNIAPLVATTIARAGYEKFGDRKADPYIAVAFG